MTALFEATRDRFRTRLELHDERPDTDPYRSLGDNASLVGVWVGAMDTAMTWSRSGVHGLCIEFSDAAAIVEADRGTESGDVGVRSDRIAIVCQNISFSGVRRGDEIAGYWGVGTDAKDAAGAFYLVRKESLPSPKADILRSKALQSTTSHAAIGVLLLFLFMALDGFAMGRWGLHLGLLLGCLIVAPSAWHQFAMYRRGRAWGRALGERQLAVEIRAPFVEERRPTAYQQAQPSVVDETRTKDGSSEGSPRGDSDSD